MQHVAKLANFAPVRSIDQSTNRNHIKMHHPYAVFAIMFIICCHYGYVSTVEITWRYIDGIVVVNRVTGFPVDGGGGVDHLVPI